MLTDLKTLGVNHALYHHNNDTWTVRAVYMFDQPMEAHFDIGSTGHHKTPQAALRAHDKLLRKKYPGWFKP